MKGEVAEAYGSLVEKLWSGTLSHTAPREFKVRIIEGQIQATAG